MKPFHPIKAGLAALTVFGLATAASAGGYPAKSVTMIVPYGAGGITDTMGRITAAKMQDSLGQKIIVVNKAGAAGTIGLSDIARSRPDGYTIAMIPAAPLAIQPHLRKLPYDLDSYTYICRTFSSPIVLATSKDSQFSNLADVIAFAKKNPGKLTFGSAGPGSLPDISMIQVMSKTGVNMRHVPMGGDAGAVTGALGGHVDMAIVAGTSVIGKDTKNIAVFANERSEQMPKAPTAKEAGFDMEFSLWGGIIAPKGLPADVTAKLQEACHTAVSSPDFAKEMAKMASTPSYLDGVEFKAYATKQFNVDDGIIKDLGLAGN